MRCTLLLVLALCAADVHGGEIWQCTRADGSVELRDTRCPDAPGVREKRYVADSGRGTFNTYEPVAPPVYPEVNPAPAADPRRPAGATPSGESDTIREKCARFEMKISAINRRLRKGYSTEEGNELRAERRRIESYLHDVCR